MSPRAIEHITVTTGAARMSPRSEVGDDVIAIIREALAADGVLGDTGWRVVHERVDGGWVYDLEYDGVGIVSCWLCLERAASDALWEAATADLLDERVIIARPKGIPWIAAAIVGVPLSNMPGVMRQAGDLERCVAWTLIEEAR